MKKYQELETKVKELQAEIERLKQEEKEDKLPNGFNRVNALEFLKTYSSYNLHKAFSWDDTPQGYEYWKNIYNSLSNNPNYNPKYVAPDKAIIQIQKWVILSFLTFNYNQQ
jgi:hypothetical protein